MKDTMNNKTISDNGPIIRTETATITHPEIAPIVDRVYKGVTCQTDVRARLGDFVEAVKADGWDPRMACAEVWYEKPGVVSSTIKFIRKIK